MKKQLLLIALISSTLMVGAQTPVKVDVPSKPQKATTITPGTNATVPGVATPRPHAARLDLTGTVIGTTTYDLQSNSSDPQRLAMDDNGNIGVVWTGSTDMGGTWPDRGTYYNFYNGTSWGAAPTNRIESVRTGWPTITWPSNSSELIYSHEPDVVGELVKINRATIGSGSWNVDNTIPLQGIWPRAAGSANNDTVHIINANYLNGNGNNFMLYHRSPDGGQTYDVIARRLPGIDTASGYNVMGGDTYAIDARGNRVAIVAGNSVNDLAVWISDDRGDTWTRTRIMDFPIDNFDGNVISDTNNDNIADTIISHDAAHTIIIDGNNKVHVWTGRMRILDVTPGDDSWSYFPGTNGLFYWNEDMGADSIEFLTGVLDLDGSNDLNGVGADVPGIGASLSSFPSAAYDDDSGKLFLVYSAHVEFTDVLGDPSNSQAESFRDLYGMYSDDGGTTWSNPVNLTYDAKDEYDNVYPTVYNKADGHVYVMWQRDQNPGHSLENTDPDPIEEQEIVFMAYDYETFETGVDGIPKPGTISFELYPNPANNQITILFEAMGDADIVITDNLGRQVYKSSNHVNGMSKLTIDINDFAPGIHFISMNVEGTRITRKFVKL